MKISIVIPVYNASAYIATTVESCLNQTLPPAEIILVNDGSTDNSLEIMQQLAGNNAQLKVYDQKNAGPSVTRNRGVGYATSDWVCFVDADDLLHPQRLEIGNAFAKDDIDAVICEFKRFDHPTIPTFDKINISQVQFLNEEETNHSVLQFGYGLPRMLMKKQVYQNSGGLDVNLVNNEDHELHFRMLTQGVKFKKIDAPLYFYRQHKGASRLSNQQSKLNYIYQALDKQIALIPLLPENLQAHAKRNLANRVASNALKQARMGDATYKAHLIKAKKLNRDLKPYKKAYLNTLSGLLGYGTMETLVGKYLK